MKAIALVTIISGIFCHIGNEKLTFLDDTPKEACWLSAYGRGVGKPIHTCAPGLEQNGLLCYPQCQKGYYGVGPVCWENCPNGFRNDGAFCFKPDSYGRGVGYPLWNEAKCNQENSQGCEKWGLIWYPKCRAGFHNVACCVCSPDCPPEMTDIGISCAKKSYGRTAGVPLTCSTNEQYDAGLCYSPCKGSTIPIGPVCWGKCPAGYNSCGALCLKDQTCAGSIKDYLAGVFNLIGDAAKKDAINGIINAGKFAEKFIYPICS